MSIKKKLLEVVQEIQQDDITEDGLLAILASRLKRQDQEIATLKSENAKAYQELYQQREHMRHEQKKMRSDPFYCASGYFHFSGLGGRRYRVSVGHNQIDLYEKPAHDEYPIVDRKREPVTPEYITRRILPHEYLV